MITAHSTRRLLAALFAAVLVLASCTQSDDDDVSSDGDDEQPTQTDTDEPGDDDGDAGGDDGDTELTASAPGVTATTITLGYAFIDFDELVQNNFSPSGWGDQALAMQSLVDKINDDGGVNNRMLEIVAKPYSVLGTESAEALCLELTEDEDVFAVLGGFLGPAEAANSCIVGPQETVLVGGVQSEERLGEAEAPWITGRPLRTRQADILLALLDDQGLLADAKIAMVTDVDAEDVRDDVLTALAEYDVEPVTDLFSDVAIGDVTAEDNVWSTFAERIRSDGADTLLIVGNATAGIRNVASNGLDLDIWALDSETVENLGQSADVEDARGVLAAAPLSGQAEWEHPTTQWCVDAFVAANPDLEIIEPADRMETDEDIAQGLTYACAMIQLFVEVAELAGPDLTNESFGAAVAEVGDFELPGQPFASLGSDKFDANDSFQLVSFDPDIGGEGGFASITELIDATP